MPFPRITPVAIVYAVAFAWLTGKAALFRSSVPPGIPPDEPPHVSYVSYVAETGRLLPRYEEMRLLDDGGRFGALPNYLPHPSLYYAALAGVDRIRGRTEDLPLDALTRRRRGTSAFLFAAVAALFLHFGFRRRAPIAAHVAYAAAVSTVPTLAFLGGAVNNDVLAFLSGAVALHGLARWLEGRIDGLTGTLVGAGLALALLSKATAGLLVTLAVLGGALVLARRNGPPAVNRRFVLALLPWLLLPVLHFVPVLLSYGTPIPSLDVVAPDAFVRSAFVVDQAAARFSFAAWGMKAAKLLASTWLSITGHAWLPVGPPWTLGGPLLLLALAGVGLLAPARGREDADPSGPALARIGAGAVALTLLANCAWAYGGYVETGRFGGLHARYYLPLLPCLGLAAVLGLRRLAAGPGLAALLAALLLLADASVTARYLALFRAQAPPATESRVP